MPVTTLVSCTQIGYKTVAEGVNTVCVMWTCVYSCWLLRDFSDQYEDISSTWPGIFITQFSVIWGVTRTRIQLLGYSRNNTHFSFHDMKNDSRKYSARWRPSKYWMYVLCLYCRWCFCQKHVTILVNPKQKHYQWQNL